MKLIYNIQIENNNLKYIFQVPISNKEEINNCKEKKLDYFFMDSNLDFLLDNKNGNLNKMTNLDFKDFSLIKKYFINYEKNLISDKEKDIINTKL